MKKRISVIHGPNLNMLGIREPEKYGSASLSDINREIEDLCEKFNMDVDIFQSNFEGEIIEKIQTARGAYDGLIINPAAYTHTSLAIRDAILLLEMPVIEIHLSNIYKREPCRQKSMLADVVMGQITGFGKQGYLLAIHAIADLTK